MQGPSTAGTYDPTMFKMRNDTLTLLTPSQKATSLDGVQLSGTQLREPDDYGETTVTALWDGSTGGIVVELLDLQTLAAPSTPTNKDIEEANKTAIPLIGTVIREFLLRISNREFNSYGGGKLPTAQVVKPRERVVATTVEAVAQAGLGQAAAPMEQDLSDLYGSAAEADVLMTVEARRKDGGESSLLPLKNSRSRDQSCQRRDLHPTVETAMTPSRSWSRWIHFYHDPNGHSQSWSHLCKGGASTYITQSGVTTGVGGDGRIRFDFLTLNGYNLEIQTNDALTTPCSPMPVTAKALPTRNRPCFVRALCCVEYDLDSISKGLV